jgi:hypothetical protein
VSTRASLPAELTPPGGCCAICGDTGWRALWQGHQELLICWRCAVEVLPRLIADATFRPHMQPADASAILDQVRAEYWRAVAICQMRDARTRDRSALPDARVRHLRRSRARAKAAAPVFRRHALTGGSARIAVARPPHGPAGCASGSKCATGWIGCFRCRDQPSRSN